MLDAAEAFWTVNKPINPNFTKDAAIVIANADVEECIKNLPSNQFNLIVSSPPYNLGKSYENKTDIDTYLTWQEQIIRELYRINSPDGSIVWQTGNYVNNCEVFPLDIYFYPIFKSLGYRLRNRVIWHFEHGLHAKKRLSGRYETILWFTKGDDYVFNLDDIRIPAKYPGKRHFKGDKKGMLSGNPLGKNPSDFWTIIQEELESGIIDIPNVKANHPEKTVHPCQFPIELIERFVLALTNENDWVLDPFGGVGSSLIAAVKNNRKGMIIDKESEYTKMASQRVVALQNGTLKFRPIGKKIYQPTGKEKVAQTPLEWIK